MTATVYDIWDAEDIGGFVENLENIAEDGWTPGEQLNATVESGGCPTHFRFGGVSYDLTACKLRSRKDKLTGKSVNFLEVQFSISRNSAENADTADACNTAAAAEVQDEVYWEEQDDRPAGGIGDVCDDGVAVNFPQWIVRGGKVTDRNECEHSFTFGGFTFRDGKPCAEYYVE